MPKGIEKSRHRWVKFFLAIVISASLSACTPPPPTAPAKITLTVFAAASLADAFTEIKTAFEQTQPNIAITFNFAGSQQLAQQIAQGAPADIFASANIAQMSAAARSGRIHETDSRIFAKNRLVAITPSTHPSAINELADLAKPGLKVVLADKAVPAGQYALDFLQKASAAAPFGPNYTAAVQKNVVSYEQDVKAVLSKVSLGEADAGIVYATDLVGAAAGKVRRIDIPNALNVLADYPIAVVKDRPNIVAAQQFVAFVTSPDGQRILQKYGFLGMKD